MIKVNNKEVKFSKFPNGETLVNAELLNQANSICRVDFKWEKDEDILYLYFMLKHLSENNVYIEAYIYYMPYSRMDRKQNGCCFTLSHICDLLDLDNVYFYIIEPHSDTTLNLLIHSERINVITPLMQKICSIEDIDVICYPDKGAKARFQDDKVNNLPVVYCEKVRDFDTGEIKGLELVSDIDLKDKNVLILDDLCSKGGTFYYTAKKLKENGANDVFLGVCHMERSVLGGKIYNDNTNPDTPIKHIYCFDTMLDKVDKATLNTNSSNMTIYDIEKFLNKSEVGE